MAKSVNSDRIDPTWPEDLPDGEHPVLIGRSHWAPVREVASGDAGARGYLAERSVRLVECGDLAVPDDVDTPEQLARFRPADGTDPR